MNLLTFDGSHPKKEDLGDISINALRNIFKEGGAEIVKKFVDKFQDL